LDDQDSQPQPERNRQSKIIQITMKALVPRTLKLYLFN
jgi:hypothetical protein